MHVSNKFDMEHTGLLDIYLIVNMCICTVCSQIEVFEEVVTSFFIIDIIKLFINSSLVSEA